MFNRIEKIISRCQRSATIHRIDIKNEKKTRIMHFRLKVLKKSFVVNYRNCKVYTKQVSIQSLDLTFSLIILCSTLVFWCFDISHISMNASVVFSYMFSLFDVF